jgi:uncharacterized protein Usg
MSSCWSGHNVSYSERSEDEEMCVWQEEDEAGRFPVLNGFLGVVSQHLPRHLSAKE